MELFGKKEEKTALGSRGKTKTVAPGIRLENVSFSFPETPVFSKLNFKIEGGLCTCILGPSGCGKSTLLHLISNNPNYSYSGQIFFDNGSRIEGNIAWMAQKDLLLPWLTVLDNVLLGAKLRNQISEDLKKKAIKLLNEIGLQNCEQKYPSELSGGMQQRTALLRTLMENRQVILMDEPFSALDALTRIKLQNLTAKLIKGSTVLLVTHDPMEALRLGDRIHVISGTPAKAGEVIIPPGDTPRNSSDAKIVSLNAHLLDKLLGEKQS